MSTAIEAPWSALSATDLAEVLPSLTSWPWQGRRIALTPIGGGLNNSNFRLSLDEGAENYFIKIPGAGTEAYVDRSLAHAAAATAAAAGIAPGVVFFDPTTGIEVDEYLDGYRFLRPNEVTSTANAFEIVEMYRRLHTSPRLPVTRTSFQDVRVAVDQVKSKGIVLDDWIWRVVDAWFEAESAIKAAGFDTAPCHNDPNFTNLMYRPGRPIQLVDYEFAANNDPTFEIGGLIGFYDFPDDIRYELLEAYYGRYEFRHEARMRLMTVGLLVRFGFWAVEKASSHDIDYDYHKYGSVYFLCATGIMRDPRWNAWLRGL